MVGSSVFQISKQQQCLNVIRQSNAEALFKDVIVKLLKLISVCKVERINEANGPAEPCLYTVAEPLVVAVE